MESSVRFRHYTSSKDGYQQQRPAAALILKHDKSRVEVEHS
jgi:hypothetical protein